jgi:hypothetical protein
MVVSSIGRSDRRHPRIDRRGEARLPAVFAVLAAAALYGLLPEHLLVAPRLVIPRLELLLLIPLVVINPRRLTRETRSSRVLSLALAVLIVAANQAALGLLLRALLTVTGEQARELLVAAAQVWLMNIIAFGLIFWELDRGGPVARTQIVRTDMASATSGSPRTRTTTPSSRSLWEPAARPTGSRHLSTTSTCH